MLRVEDVLERITDAVSAVDSSWRITYVNGAAERIAQRSRSSLLGRILWDEYPDLLGTELERKYRQAMREQVSVHFEYHYPPLKVWVAIGAYPSPSGLTIYTRDITQQKRAELELARSELRYRLIAETAHEGMWLVDADYRTIWTNPRLAELLGTSTGELLGRRVSEFVYEADMPEFRRRVAERREGRAGEYDIRMRRADGAVIWVLACIAPVLGPDGRFEGALGMLTDISERKRMEQELREQKERFRVTLASIGDAVIATDAAARITFMNSMAEALTGWPASEAIGAPIAAVFRILNEETREPVENPVTRVLREGCVVGLANHTALVARDGTERPVDDSGAPIHDAEGRVVGVVLVFRDNTERVLAERALREADRRKDEFLAMLGHELRNPLAPIANAVEIMRHRPDDRALQAQAREVVARQVQHMTRLVNDLLDVARVTSGAIALQRTPARIEDLLARALETLRPLLEQRGQTVRTEPGGSVVVEVDETRIVQVVGNLLHNASKFSPEGAEIVLGWVRQDDEVCVRVADAGRGIPPEMLETIFQPFLQARPSLDRAQGGLGLGLTLVQKLVDLHGGRVRARSDGPGRGSEFCFWLPLARQEPAAVLAAGSAAPALHPLRVLVVDDNEDGAQTLGSLLGLLGHEVTVAQDAEETLRRVRSAPPDVAILDIGMPSVSGYELARLLRAEFGARLKLLAHSGFGQQQDLEQARAAGFDVHLVKPVSVEALQNALIQLFTPAD